MSTASTNPTPEAPQPRVWQHLERDLKSSYKQLSIKGRRIRARTLYGQHVAEEGPRTVEELAVDFDLPLEAVREAIEYCESDPPEILEDWRRDRADMQARGMLEPNYKFHPSPKILSIDQINEVERA